MGRCVELSEYFVEEVSRTGVRDRHPPLLVLQGDGNLGDALYGQQGGRYLGDAFLAAHAMDRDDDF